MKRLTIRDIAEATGVSPGAVSFALNNKPGVSEATRKRIIETATELGWSPNPVARALSSSRTSTIGLALTRPYQTIRDEGFYFAFTCGAADALSNLGMSLVLRMARSEAQESDIYRDWKAGPHVDGVIVVDLTTEDTRPDLLASLDIPFVTVGTDVGVGSALVIDDAEAMKRVVTHIFAQGFRRPAYVAGIRGFAHTDTRRKAFSSACSTVGLKGARSYMSDYTEDAGAAITRTIMEKSPDTDMIIYDNEILTLGGMAYLRAHGLDVPGQVGIFSWEDSPLCRVLSPAISALGRDPEKLGSQAASLLVDSLSSKDRLTREFATPQIVARASTTMRIPLSHPTRTKTL